MMKHDVIGGAFALMLLSGGVLHADAQARPRPVDRQQQREQGQQLSPRRQQLEQQLRRRLWSVTKQQVGLTDDQMMQLGQTTRKFDMRRRALNQDERAQREVLRTQILAGDKTDQARIAVALDRLQQLQRQRLDIQADEQTELAKFMSPLQRAKYVALQEQVRRRIEALRRQRPDSVNAPGPATVPPPAP